MDGRQICIYFRLLRRAIIVTLRGKVKIKRFNAANRIIPEIADSFQKQTHYN
jgi:hypothetical protein